MLCFIKSTFSIHEPLCRAQPKPSLSVLECCYPSQIHLPLLLQNRQTLPQPSKPLFHVLPQENQSLFQASKSGLNLNLQVAHSILPLKLLRQNVNFVLQHTKFGLQNIKGESQVIKSLLGCTGRAGTVRNTCVGSVGAGFHRKS